MDTRKLFVDNFDRLKNHRYEGDNFQTILSQPRAFWYGWGRYDKKKLPEKSVRRLLKRAGDEIVTLVLYNIPERDLNHYSKGGASTVEEYKEYVDSFSKGIEKDCIVIVEPDALPHLQKLDSDSFALRSECLNYAVDKLTQTNAKVYIDVGHPNWLTPNQISMLLLSTMTDSADGFSVNVSNFVDTETCIEWASKVSHLTGGMNFIIDTSRNGAETDTWLNPKDAKIGTLPTLNTNIDFCDGFLWIKIPGESDGKSEGAPPAGKFFKSYLENLIK
tara:strand:- start:859 stop:1683 length:825 start_codon:yes stop_codon:yes gene_type:complete